MKRLASRSIGFSGILALLTLLAPAGPSEVQRVISEIVRDSYQAAAPRRQHRLLESDLNAYVAQRLSEERPQGVQEIVILLQSDDRLGTRMLVDIDQLGQAGGNGGGGWLGSLLSGVQRLEFEGQLDTSQGQGRYEIERVSLNGFPIPVALVKSLLRSWGSRMEPPINFDEPFQLPYGIQEIDIDQGYTVITTGH